MTVDPTLHQHSFDEASQRTFAAVSGDHNPLHLDAMVARRTQAGAPVVHGVALLLWALDVFAARAASAQPVRGMHVRFLKFVYVGETVALDVAEHDGRRAVLRICVGDTPVTQIKLDYGGPSNERDATAGPLPLLTLPETPADLALEEMAGRCGRLPFAAAPASIAALYPAAAAWLSPERVAALAASTNLVGMVCPGLYSIYAGLAIACVADSNPEDSLRFRVTAASPRYRLVEIAIAGGGISGTLESLVRPPPAQQPALEACAAALRPDEFAGSVALVIGGSRGVGEVTAKLVAAGGGRVIITYKAGRADAEDVAREINARGGRCEILAYDALAPAEPQLEPLKHLPTHLYYCATPPIFGRHSPHYTRRRFDEFLAFYVDGFRDLVAALHARRPELAVFYPSSIAVDARPRGMTEYAMAKAAGEVLCADLNEALAPLRIFAHRLPRIATDQTASFAAAEAQSALETMLPLVRELQSVRHT